MSRMILTLLFVALALSADAASAQIEGAARQRGSKGAGSPPPASERPSLRLYRLQLETWRTGGTRPTWSPS